MVFPERDDQTFLQPAGQSASSRRSEQSEDLRTEPHRHSQPGGVPDVLHLFEVPDHFGIVIRRSATTGYYLAALRAARPRQRRLRLAVIVVQTYPAR
jgi:hypothetical protein